jgi:hypothetical protein
MLVVIWANRSLDKVGLLFNWLTSVLLKLLRFPYLHVGHNGLYNRLRVSRSSFIQNNTNTNVHETPILRTLKLNTLEKSLQLKHVIVVAMSSNHPTVGDTQGNPLSSPSSLLSYTQRHSYLCPYLSIVSKRFIYENIRLKLPNLYT